MNKSFNFYGATHFLANLTFKATTTVIKLNISETK